MVTATVEFKQQTVKFRSSHQEVLHKDTYKKINKTGYKEKLL